MGVVEADVVRIPAIVCGRAVEADLVHVFEYADDCTVHIPRLSDAHVDEIVAAPNPLEHVDLDDILGFLDRVSRRWADPQNPWRALARRLGPVVTGLNRDNFATDLAFMATCMQYPVLYGMLETEFGDPNVLGAWQTRKSTRVRAWPKGLVAHVLVGNVPMAGFLSLIRSMITKNSTVAKLPSRDVVTALCLAHCMRDVDPDHPVVRSLTVAYWTPTSETETRILERADVVAVWGRTDSIDSVRARTSAGTDVIEFGTKRSLSVIAETADWREAGMWVAYDVANYEQEACFSVKEVFVVGDARPLVESVTGWLARLADVMPPTARVLDADASIHRERLVQTALGSTVHGPPEADWTVVVVQRDHGPIDIHPMGRTLFVHEVNALDDVLAYVDHDVQTVALEPFDLADDFGAKLGAAGVDRIVRLGRTGRGWPEGFVHDGFYPLQRMVRWTAIESPLGWFYRMPNFDRQMPGDEFRRHSEYALGLRGFNERAFSHDTE